MGNGATWLSVAYALGWSGFGFLLGYVVARLSCEVHEVKEAMVPRHDHKGAPRRSPAPLFATRRKGDLRNLAIGVGVVLLALATLITSAVSISRQGQIVRCQSRYNEGVARALEARTLAAAEDRTALVHLVSEISVAQGKTPPDAGAARKALADYLKATADADRRRQRDPLPPPPAEVCK